MDVCIITTSCAQPRCFDNRDDQHSYWCYSVLVVLLLTMMYGVLIVEMFAAPQHILVFYSVQGLIVMLRIEAWAYFTVV